MDRNIYEEVIGMLEVTLKKEPGTLEENLTVKSNLGMDSLNFIDFLIHVEDRFSVDLMNDFEEVQDMTVRELGERICELIDKKKEAC